MKKYISPIFFLPLLFFCLFFYTQALALEIQYPRVGSTQGLVDDATLPQYFKYIFDIGMGLGIIIVIATLTIGGVVYATSSVYPKWKAWASDRISGAITGFFLLLFTYLIITTINPSLNVFRFNFTATPTPPTPPPTQALTPGVYLYTTTNCTAGTTSPDSTFTFYTSSVNNLGSIGNKLKSGKIIQDTTNNIYYTMFFHDLPNFQGGCHQIDPNTPCTADDATASSMSVYRYNPQDDGNGVIFYRNPFFKTAGGWKKVSKGEIASMPEFNLENLTFDGNGGDCTVPEIEQDCIKWDISGQCSKDPGSRTCPKLTPKNINSIDVGGKYFVVFYYNGRPVSSTNPYSYSNCQIFPTPEDINFYGPKEMKWDYIRNYGDVPNVMAIFPIVR